MISQNHARRSAPTGARPASRRLVPEGAPGPADSAWLNADIELARLGGVNVLLTGPAARCERVLGRLRLGLPRPIVVWRSSRPLVLPPPDQAGTLVLRGVDRVSRADQERLLAWLDGTQVKVISTATKTLIPSAAGEGLLPPLYYRLNMVCIELPRSVRG